MMKKFAAAGLNERNSDPWNKGGGCPGPKILENDRRATGLIDHYFRQTAALLERLTPRLPCRKGLRSWPLVK